MSGKRKRSPATSTGQASPDGGPAKAVKTTLSDPSSRKSNTATTYPDVIDLTQSDDEDNGVGEPILNAHTTIKPKAGIAVSSKSTAFWSLRSENNQISPSTHTKDSQLEALTETEASALQSSPSAAATTTAPSAGASWKDTLKVGSLVLAHANGFRGLYYGRVTLIGPPQEYDPGYLDFYTKSPYKVQFFHRRPTWGLSRRFGVDDLHEPYVLDPPPAGLTFEQRTEYLLDALEVGINDMVLAKFGKGSVAAYYPAKVVSEQKQKGRKLSYGVEFLESKTIKTKLRRRHMIPMFGDSATVLDAAKQVVYPHTPVKKGQQGPLPVPEIQRVRRFKNWLEDAAEPFFSVEEDTEDEDDGSQEGEGEEDEASDDEEGEEERGEGLQGLSHGSYGGEEELRDPEEHELCYHCGNLLDLNNPTEVATRDCGECE